MQSIPQDNSRVNFSQLHSSHINPSQLNSPRPAPSPYGLTALESYALMEMLLTFADLEIAAVLGQSARAISGLREKPESASCWCEMLARSVREGETLRARAMQRKKARAVTLRREEKAIFGTVDAAGGTPESVASPALKRGNWQDMAGWLMLLLIASVLAGMFAAHHHLFAAYHHLLGIVPVLNQLIPKGIS